MSKITIFRIAKVIHFYFLLNVTNVYFIVSLVPRASVKMKITKDYLITSDVLIWKLYGPVQRIQYENYEGCFFKRSNYGEDSVLTCSRSLRSHYRLTKMGFFLSLLGYSVAATYLSTMKKKNNLFITKSAISTCKCF